MQFLVEAQREKQVIFLFFSRDVFLAAPQLTEPLEEAR